jgi:hypothetical protein
MPDHGHHIGTSFEAARLPADGPYFKKLMSEKAASKQHWFKKLQPSFAAAAARLSRWLEGAQQ